MSAPKTYSAILKAISELQGRAEAARIKEAAGVIKRIQDAMQVYGLTVEDLTKQPPAKPRAAAKATGRKAKRPVKYSDSNGNTWAGGGSMPVWLREQVEQGKDIEEFLTAKTG